MRLQSAWLCALLALASLASACERSQEADRIDDVKYVRTGCDLNLTMHYFASPEGTSTRDYGLSVKFVMKPDGADEWIDVAQAQLEPSDFTLNETNTWGPIAVTLSGPTRIRGMLIDRNSFGDRITGTCASTTSGTVDYDYRHFDNYDIRTDCAPEGIELIDLLIAIFVAGGALSFVGLFALWRRCSVRVE